MRTAVALTTVLLLARTSSGEPTEFPETGMYEFEVSSIKQGEWVEYQRAVDPSGTTVRWACVEVESIVVWIEISSSEPGSEVLLLGVSKVSNLVLFAYMGKAGEVGRKLKVTERREMTVVRQRGGKQIEIEGKRISPEADRKASPAEQAKCTVSPDKEEISVGEQKFVCEKWTLEYNRLGDANEKCVESWWVSERVPFARRLDKAGNPMVHSREVPWEGNRTFNGGSVKEAEERPVQRTTMLLKAIGTDAKPTLKTKASAPEIEEK
ncbi:MAG: hypothetical protein HYY18_11590 [Planctomycetes bacterium]|nr:hypothetical protein [Planctomycetota bacterium]